MVSAGKKHKSSPSLHVIEISSDSEVDDGVTRFQLQSRGSKYHDLSSSGKNAIVELTDTDSMSDSSCLPDTLSPLVNKLRRKENGGLSTQQSSFNGFVPLYVDTSDEEESDQDCILVLNDPPGSRRPILKGHPANGQDVTKGSLKDAVPEHSQSTRKSSNKDSSQKVKEQARLQHYAAELFTQLNKDVFGDRLPQNTSLEWSKRLLTTAGRARWHRSRDGIDTTRIELASKILDCDERIRNTLSHEMCHLACWVIDNQPREGHGQLFKSWASKVMNKHPDIHVSTRHNYEISYPYEWKCEKCSKIYGRHSKSIRSDECVCGVCKAGKLIPQFVERRPTILKVSRMAVAKPRDLPHLTTRNPPKKTYRPSTDLDDKNISNIVEALNSISIDSIGGSLD